MNVLILGLGQYPLGSGMAAALHFVRQKNAKVTVYDFYYTKAMDANIARLKKFKNVRFVLGKHKLDEIKNAHLIVKHQRIRQNEPEVRLAHKLGKIMDSELSIFLRACPCLVVGITGTRGKSTTTAMIHGILSKSWKWRNVWLGGNILVSPLTFLSKVKTNDLVVLEMSSFQLEGTGEAGVSPQIAVWTNLMRDHLNAYPSMTEYAEAKAQIFRNQKPEDVVFLPADKMFNVYAKTSPGHVVRVTLHASRFTLRVPGEHNQMNASFAEAVGTFLGVKKQAIRKSLKAFKGLPNRIETVATKKGVTFINDTTATTPDGTMAALKSVKSVKSIKSVKSGTIHLIFGGADKELEFGQVAKELKTRKDVAAYLLKGTAERKIRKAGIKGEWFQSLNEAMREIRLNAKRGDVVLLSPGCTSFGMFKNEFDRGEQFVKLVKKWK